MRFIADFHIHSHYSRATTPQLTPENLDYWSRLKGIHVMGTGDCVHPGWLRELKETLEPVGNGLYQLKPDYRLAAVSSSALAERSLQFLLTTEISSIYKKRGKVRKVHNICVLPDFESTERFQARLMRIGNVESDGRPILGLDARNLLEILLESSPNAFLIPAHIWTPWFSVLGSQSGFDSIEECFDDLTPHIFALETGLSSDPAMNRICSRLDGFRLVSNSDAHSPEKIGREANLFDTELSYTGVLNALKNDDGFLGTIEFFPHEGKYHYDGHRNCGIRWDPLTTLAHGGLCPACRKPVTRGVLYRVAELADRPLDTKTYGKQGYYSITPLPELIAETLGQKSTTGQAVKREHLRLLQQLGSEFHVLLFADIDEIRRVGGDLLAEGIRRLRQGHVFSEPGFDGEFGKIRVFKPGEAKSLPQGNLFGESGAGSAHESATGNAEPPAYDSIAFDVAAFQQAKRECTVADAQAQDPASAGGRAAAAQEEAVAFGEGVVRVIAGPGSGKTRTLVERIVRLVETKSESPKRILAVTFSNKAVEEIRTRLRERLKTADAVTVATFHAFGLQVLREHAAEIDRSPDFTLIDDDERREIVREFSGGRVRDAASKLKDLSAFKQGWLDQADDDLAVLYDAYERALRERNALDLDDLIWRAAQLFKENPAIRAQWQARVRWILVDEFQDVNARQYELIALLGGEAPNLFAIGDPDQAIYGFRGSDVRLMDRLEQDYPRTQTIRLTQSFRCPSPVLRGAGQILQKSETIAGIVGEIKIHIQRCPSDKSEADWIAAKIERMIGGVRSYSMHTGVSEGTAEAGIASFRDFAILCRTSAQFGLIAQALAQHGIAYQIVGTEPLYAREPWAAAVRRARRVLLRPAEAPRADETLAQLIAAGRPAAEVIAAALQDEVSDDERRLFAFFAAPFESDYAAFFRAVVLRQGVDDYDVQAERVSVMTMHASKGLEFPVVFIAGCEDGLIPFDRFGKKSERELAEEERLLYVAMTRTKRHLFLTHAAKRLVQGKPLAAKRSPFLDRVEKNLLDLGVREAKPLPAERQLSMWS